MRLVRGGWRVPLPLRMLPAEERDMSIGHVRVQDTMEEQELVQGQVWWVDGRAVELLGEDGGRWSVRNWERRVVNRVGSRRAAEPVVGETLRLALGSECRGAGAGPTMVEIGTGPRYRVHLSPDRVPAEGGGRAVVLSRIS